MTDPAAILTNLAFWTPGPGEMIVILIIGLLIFGKRLPEVGRSLGKGIVEFKRGIKGIETEIEDEARKPERLEDSYAAPPPLSGEQQAATSAGGGDRTD